MHVKKLELLSIKVISYLGVNGISLNSICMQVTTQTSLMVNKPVKSTKLSWKWHSEIMEDTLNGKGSFSNESLLEQIMTTGDASDYLWYMTR